MMYSYKLLGQGGATSQVWRQIRLYASPPPSWLLLPANTEASISWYQTEHQYVAVALSGVSRSVYIGAFQTAALSASDKLR